MVCDNNLGWVGGCIGGELNTCRQLFKELNILTLASLYIMEVTCFYKKILSHSEAKF